MVGSSQDIHCIVNTVSGVELSSVMISWMAPGGESITNDSRVTISPTTASGYNYTSSLQFTYLMEGDEGMYTCNVLILDTTASNFIGVYNLTGTYICINYVTNNKYTVLYVDVLTYCICMYHIMHIKKHLILVSFIKTLSTSLCNFVSTFQN